MSRSEAFDPKQSKPPAQASKPQGRPYQSPRLEKLGDIRDLVLGGSPGVNDTFNPGNEDPLGGSP